MKTNLLIGGLIFIAFCITNCATKSEITISESEEKKPATGEYALVWSDEFDYEGRPDSDNWTYEKNFVRNKELQWYQSENAFCENGLLVIEGRRERVTNPYYDPSSNDWRINREEATYTSASVTTKNRHSWKYGRFEIKARIKTQPGLWPAIWTLGLGHEWPSGGEIDIMEFYRGDILANAAWAGKNRWQAVWDDSKKPVSSFDDPDWDDKFHVWRMDWTQTFIKLYVDDELLNTIELSKTINERGSVRNPFRETSQFLLLNLAIGGTNGGDPSNTTFPSRYEIDYVKVYQK